MKFGLQIVNIDMDSPSGMLAIAEAAEARGFESVWTAEHPLMPVKLESPFPYTPDGKVVFPADLPIMDPFVCLSAIAARTTTLMLGTGISLLPLHNPLIFAKQAASLDFISGGRLILGFGVGWAAEDYAAANVPFNGRGARMDDYIAAMKKVWTGDVVEHESEFLNWHAFKSYPLPVRKDIPITIGGRGEKNFERIAKSDAGWFGPAGTIEGLKRDIELLKAACAKYGRDFNTVEISMWRNGEAELTDLDTIKKCEELGVHRVWSVIPGSSNERLDTVHRLADQLLG